MHRPHDSLRPRRRTGIPVTVAASLALTAGLLCSTSAAHAAVMPPGSPTTSASATGIGAALTAKAFGDFVLLPGETPKIGTEVKWAIKVKNTGDVPLDNVAEQLAPPGFSLEPGQARELTYSTFIDQRQFDMRTAIFDWFVPATTPDGVRFTARIDSGRPFPEPAPTPTPTPTSTSTSTSTPTSTPTSTSTPVEAPSLSAAARGELALTPGETPVVGTRVDWTVSITNTGDVDVFDLTVEGSEAGEVDLQPGQTRDLTLSTTIGQRELDDRAAVLTTSARGDTKDGENIDVDVTGALALPFSAPNPTPTAPTPQEPTPTAAPGASVPAPSQGTPVTVVPVASGSTGSTLKGSPAAEASTRRLADTGSDAAGLLPAAGILTALGALGVLVGTRRRRDRSAH